MIACTGIVDGAETAELKRIWTDRRFRQRGFARMLLDEPEAEALYTAAG